MAQNESLLAFDKYRKTPQNHVFILWYHRDESWSWCGQSLNQWVARGQTLTVKDWQELSSLNIESATFSWRLLKAFDEEEDLITGYENENKKKS